jgi:hypothetical protein
MNQETTNEREPMRKLYYMRDNHTFRLLPLDVEQAISVLRDEFDERYTYGMLCSKSFTAADGYEPCHARQDFAEFEPRARQWLTRWINFKSAADLEFESWQCVASACASAAPAGPWVTLGGGYPGDPNGTKKWRVPGMSFMVAYGDKREVMGLFDTAAQAHAFVASLEADASPAAPAEVVKEDGKC